MKRGAFVTDGGRPTNASGRSGAFSVSSHPDDDGIIGDETFVPLWSGMQEMGWLTDRVPAPSALVMPFYFQDMMPYNWS